MARIGIASTVLTVHRTYCAPYLLVGFRIRSIRKFFGPPESGSGSFYQQAKLVRSKKKTLIAILLWHLYVFLCLKNDMNVPSKSNKQESVANFFWLLAGYWQKQQDPVLDLDPDLWVRGTDPGSGCGSVPNLWFLIFVLFYLKAYGPRFLFWYTYICMVTRQFSSNMVCSSYVIYTDNVNVYYYYQFHYTQIQQRNLPIFFFHGNKKI